MTDQTAPMLQWSEQVLSSIYWSDVHSVWKWTVSRRSDGTWSLWQQGECFTFRGAAAATATAYVDLAELEGVPLF